jgi:gamma-glutamyl-gamma-aminobutyrate hydrolase PuuD
MSKPTILVLGDKGDGLPFFPWGHLRFSYKEYYATRSAENVDAVVFTGGTDVDTRLYGEERGSFTGKPDVFRDEVERRVFDIAIRRKIPMMGICRGSQFGCVMSGGKLFQHVSGHGVRGAHPAMTIDGEEIHVTSTHHQMLNVRGTDHQVLVWASPTRSEQYLGEDDVPQTPPDKEPEVVWFPQTKFLATQYHPEYMDEQTTGWKYYQRLLANYIFEGM